MIQTEYITFIQETSNPHHRAILHKTHMLVPEDGYDPHTRSASSQTPTTWTGCQSNSSSDSNTAVKPQQSMCVVFLKGIEI